jgi:hypothetical protein
MVHGAWRMVASAHFLMARGAQRTIHSAYCACRISSMAHKVHGAARSMRQGTHEARLRGARRIGDDIGIHGERRLASIILATAQYARVRRIGARRMARQRIYVHHVPHGDICDSALAHEHPCTAHWRTAH